MKIILMQRETVLSRVAVIDYNFPVMKTFCFKLYNSDHNKALMRQINIAGLIYNHCLALHKRYYRLFGKTLNANRLKVHLTKLKRTKRFAYMSKLCSQAVQDVAERIDRAYKSFTLKQAGWSLDEKTGRIRLGKKWYGYFQSRKIEGKVKTVTVKRDAVGDIYVYLVCDVQAERVGYRTGKSVGLDFGLAGLRKQLRFLTASDGHDIESPEFFALNAQRIKSKHRRLSWKKRGSLNYERARLELARAYRKMDNQRHDFHFKLAMQCLRLPECGS